MTFRAYKRAATLTLARPAVSTRGGRFGAYFRQGNGITIGGAELDQSLRFTFRVTKDLKPEPNYTDLTVYNLSETHRAEFSRKPVHIRLEVGYDGETQGLFVGDLRWSDSQREGPDWRTQIQAGDGERAYRHARVNRSFKPGVSVRDALAEAAGSMELELPAGLSTLIPDVGKQFAGGLAMAGPAHREMTRLLRPLGAEWSIQDGRLVVLPGNGAKRDTAILLGGDGLPVIGSPEFGPPEKDKPPTLKVKTLLFPGFTCGGRIQLKTRGVSGLFKVVQIVHTGDTMGQDWYSSLEATQL